MWRHGIFFFFFFFKPGSFVLFVVLFFFFFGLVLGFGGFGDLYATKKGGKKKGQKKWGGLPLLIFFFGGFSGFFFFYFCGEVCNYLYYTHPPFYLLFGCWRLPCLGFHCIFTLRKKESLNHLPDQFSQHHQSIIHIIIPGFAKTDADTIAIITTGRKYFPRYNGNIMFHCFCT